MINKPIEVIVHGQEKHGWKAYPHPVTEADRQKLKEPHPRLFLVGNHYWPVYEKGHFGEQGPPPEYALDRQHAPNIAGESTPALGRSASAKNHASEILEQLDQITESLSMSEGHKPDSDAGSHSSSSESSLIPPITKGFEPNARNREMAMVSRQKAYEDWAKPRPESLGIIKSESPARQSQHSQLPSSHKVSPPGSQIGPGCLKEPDAPSKMLEICKNAFLGATLSAAAVAIVAAGAFVVDQLFLKREKKKPSRSPKFKPTYGRELVTRAMW